jgi:hypothetical protein
MVKTIVIPQLLYASELWWKGTPLSGGDNWGYKYLLTHIDRVLNTALRRALLVYRTTPSSALHKESQIPGA